MSQNPDIKKYKKAFTGETSPLIDLCLAVSDCPHYTPKWTGSGKLVIRNFNIKNGRLDLSEKHYTDNETFKDRIKRHAPEPGDLIITREAPMGQVCIIPDGLECCLGQRMVLIKPDPLKVNKKYLLYTLLSEYVQNQIQKSNTSGSIVSNLCIPDLEQLNIPILPLPEQDRIADTLASLDAKISLNNRINTELERLAKTLYDYWFVQFDYPTSAAYAASVGKPHLESKPYRSSGGEMVWNEELKREVPRGWGVGTFEDIAFIIGGSTPSTENPDNFSENGTPWITPKDLALNMGKKFITRGENDVSQIGLKAASLNIMPKGAVLLSSRAPIGYLAISRGDVTTNQGFKSFVPKPGYSSGFVYYLTSSYIPTFMQKASGSTFKEIPGSTLKEIEILIPPKILIENFDKQIIAIFERQDLLELESQELNRLRDFLLPLLMSGEVNVRDECLM